MISILILTDDLILFNSMSKLLEHSGYSCIMSDLNNVLLNIYRHNIRCIIIDLDYCDKITLSALEDLCEFDYIPIVGIYNHSHSIEERKLIKHFIQKDSINSSITEIIDSFLDFKLHYDKVRECNEAIDIMNTEIDRLFRSHAYSVKSLIENTFVTSQVLENKPSQIIYFSVKDDGTEADLYIIDSGELVKESNVIRLKSNSFLKDNITIKTEFFSNCDKNQYSDVDNYKALLEGLLHEKGISIRNFAGFATTDTAVIAINYNGYVTSSDAKVIKMFCINLNLIKNVYRKIDDVNNAFKYTIEALARAGEAADDDTGSHIKRVNEYSKFIAECMDFDKEFIDIIYYSAQMHDVGKIHIPQNILNKKGKLSDDEFNIIKQHTVYGPKIIGNSPYLKMAAEIALNHHEKYDGSGYPNGIQGENIPMSARIVALADIYDALRSPRCYKEGYSHEKTVEIIVNGDGRVKPCHFDPEVLNVFSKNHKQFDKIWSSLI